MSKRTFTLHDHDNPCPLCDSSDKRCKVTDDGIQLCMTLTRKESVPGFEFRKLDSSRTWGVWVPAKTHKTEEEEHAWKVQVQRHKLETDVKRQEDRRNALTPTERDAGYRKMLSMLTLADCDRNDLLNRGLTNEQIESIGYRSVEQWQKLPESLDSKLPGLSAKGLQLNVPEPGYLCPAYDAKGRICAFQVRSRNAEDGRKYYWLTGRTKNNPEGAIPNLRSGELPIPVFWPEEITKNQIAFVEGVGSKHVLAALRLGCPVIGAAGAQWGSSRIELKKALTEVLKRLSGMEGTTRFVLYPDAGMLDPKHRLVRLRYEDLKTTLGFPLNVAWWGQESKEDGDIDEISDVSVVRLITYEEFSNYANDDDEIPQDVLLEIEVAKYNSLEDKPFAQALQENSIGTDFNVRGRRLTRLSLHASGGAPESSAMLGDLIGDTFDEIEQRSMTDETPGIKTGFYDIDSMTGGGFQRTDLIIAAGRPAMGKTTICMNIADNVASSGQPVAIFSLEMSKQQLTYRLLSARARIESGRLRTGRIGQHEWEPLGHAISGLSRLPILIDDNPDPSVAYMQEECLRLRDEKKQDLGLVVIDYLQLMGGGSENRVQELSRFTRAMKKMAKDLNVPVVCLSQLSRGVESRTNKRPMMSDLRESGSIEQDADLIMMLYREEYYDPDTPDHGLAEVILAKHRNGPTGIVKLLFEPQYTLFRNLAREKEYAEVF